MASYEFEFSPKELLRLLFFKKICPYCTKKLIKVKDRTFLDRGWYRMNGSSYYGNQYHLKFYYYCNNCSKNIQLNELRHRKFFNDL
ncbi:hypothetical protein PAECIP111891_07057 [Paenibacillus allorhizoplanae]|uniref:Uncharacterized protein n=1 Tax=Paenibacillus allorhizoplanae TaxID=2905648 RepID=A0ABM9D1I5_9BACL|nr:hypothetical protein PAECIP111891_07057 [Paenibacillus allorhizoplanae]